jgi:cytosine/adenosine deaminase-related metal-dependent hydrolase
MHARPQTHLEIRGARCVFGPCETAHASIEIVGDRIGRILPSNAGFSSTASERESIDLGGFLLFPGFVNAHDHLQFALYPRLGNPPYRNYVEWGDDIHSKFPELIAMHRTVPKETRLWWGGLRNLLCGVTTVAHHDPLWQELRRHDFPVRVVQDYGWAHSVALGGDLVQARAATPDGQPFIVHACEGVDDLARHELSELDHLGVLDESTVLVHGLAIDQDGIALMRERRASLIVCPSSNRFLFASVPNISLLGVIENIALGSDSPLTAEGNLLDEIQFAMRFVAISPSNAYRMVTTNPAATLRLRNGEGSIKESGFADLVAIRDTGQHMATRLESLSMNDVQLVLFGGGVHLAAEAMLARLPSAATHGLEPLSIGGAIRWLRAPVRALLRKAEHVLGTGQVQLGRRKVHLPALVGAEHDN